MLLNEDKPVLTLLLRSNKMTKFFDFCIKERNAAIDTKRFSFFEMLKFLVLRPSVEKMSKSYHVC
jgi:hypothetical protein